MKKELGTDLTVGSVPRHLLMFSVPMLLGNLIYLGYSVINTVWVGHLVGEDAVGAVGVSFPVLFVLIGLVMGISMATTILVSQYYGARDFPMVERVVNNSFALAFIIGTVLTILAFLSCDPLLRLMETPSANFAMASVYLKISVAGFILSYFSFLVSSILRGIGDTVTPLIFMSVGLGVNAILDPFFIGGFGPFPLRGLEGAAWATIVSQVVTVVIIIVYLDRKNHMVAFRPGRLTLDAHMAGLLCKIGFPSMVQQTLVSVSTIFVAAFVNTFGSSATNAFGAVMRVDMFAFMPALSISMAVAALTGQNLGALKPHRVKEIFRWGALMTSASAIFISLLAVFLARPILAMFGLGDDPAAMDIGVTYLRIVGSCYIFFALMFIPTGVINGAGHTMITMFFTLISLWCVRVPLSWFLMKTSLGITGIWISVAGSFLVTMAISLTYYLSGRWKRSVVIKAAPTIPFME